MLLIYVLSRAVARMNYLVSLQCFKQVKQPVNVKTVLGFTCASVTLLLLFIYKYKRRQAPYL